MSLNKLCLFKNVKITPDYSVVHDMDIETWKKYLLGWLDPMPADSDTPEIVLSQTVNYYRMPEVIRVEGNYDAIRKATYGFLEDGRHEGNEHLRTSFKVLFFWVKDVRLLKQAANVDNTDPSDPLWKDVCELDVELDVWSTYAGCFELFDSYIERRHMPRWENKGTDLSPDWQPIYYPNAAQGIEGSYESESVQELITPFVGPQTDKKYMIYTIYVVYMDTSGVITIYRGYIAYVQTLVDDVYTYVHTRVHRQIGVYDKDVFDYTEILDGTFYTKNNLNAAYVQAIFVTPCTDLQYFTEKHPAINPDSGPWILVTEEGSYTDANDLVSYTGRYEQINRKRYGYNVTPIAPDHSHIEGDGTGYDEQHEPMMYYKPARDRKVTTAFGGELFDIPDIVAFNGSFECTNTLDLNSCSVFVYKKTSGLDRPDDMSVANSIGCMGVVTPPTLPIFSSAWKNYEAISKMGDEINYNAAQTSNIVNGAAGILSSVAMAAVPVIGPALAALNMGTSAATGLTNVYKTKAELEAKQVTIKNSPCVVTSGGSGVGAIIDNIVHVCYVSLKMDDQSMEKLRFMYYWFGYHVNRTFKGIIDLETREVFDFIKTSGAKVKGDISAGEAMKLATIFDNGVTIYHGKDGYAKIGDGTMWNNDEV